MEQKITFKDRQEPIQIFCPQKFKGYFIRGQLEEISDNVYNPEKDEYFYAFYHFTIYALVSNQYIKEFKKSDDYIDQYGVFEHGTLTEFLKARRKYFTRLAKEAPSTKGNLQDDIDLYLKNQNDPIEFNFKNINESPYLLKAIRDKKNIILLRLILTLDRLESPTDGTLIANYPKKLYVLPAYHLSEMSDYEERDIQNWFHNLHEILFYNLEYDFENPRNRLIDLNDIGNLSWEWIKRKTISGKNLGILNSLYPKLKKIENPYKEFCFSFLKELTSDLVTSKTLGQCSLCGDFFKYAVSKKYCSLLSEGKDCGKRARNQRHYIKHKAKILPKARNYNKELQAFYKEKGIKKCFSQT